MVLKPGRLPIQDIFCLSGSGRLWLNRLHISRSQSGFADDDGLINHRFVHQPELERAIGFFPNNISRTVAIKIRDRFE